MVRRKFDDNKFLDDFEAGPLRSALYTRVFQYFDEDDYWRGVFKASVLDDGVEFRMGPDRSSLASVTVTVDPEGDLEFDVHSIDHIRRPRSIPSAEWKSPWEGAGIQAELASILSPYIVEDKAAPIRERGRALRGFAETSKAFETTSGKALPEGVQSHIASYLSGEKPSAGPPQEQMKKLKSAAENTSNGGRRKTKRSSKKRRITRRR